MHLCDYPKADSQLLDSALNQRMATAQVVVSLGHKLRDEAGVRVRQPLSELRYTCVSHADTSAPEIRMAAINSFGDLIEEELNVKQLTPCESLADLTVYSYKPNLKTLGPKYGKLLGALRQKLATLEPSTLDPLRRGESVSLEVEGESVDVSQEDIIVSREHPEGWVTGEDRGIQLALATGLTEELKREGMARDFVRHVQQLRKDADLEIEDRINVLYHSDNGDVDAAIREWNDYIRVETLAMSVTSSAATTTSGKSVKVGSVGIMIRVEKCVVGG